MAVTQQISTESSSLETHVDLCHQRYKQLEDRMERNHQELKESFREITESLKHTNKNLELTNEKISLEINSIKDQLQAQSNSQHKIIISLLIAIIASLIAGAFTMLEHI